MFSSPGFVSVSTISQKPDVTTVADRWWYLGVTEQSSLETNRFIINIARRNTKQEAFSWIKKCSESSATCKQLHKGQVQGVLKQESFWQWGDGVGTVSGWTVMSLSFISHFFLQKKWRKRKIWCGCLYFAVEALYCHLQRSSSCHGQDGIGEDCNQLLPHWFTKMKGPPVVPRSEEDAHLWELSKLCCVHCYLHLFNQAWLKPNPVSPPHAPGRLEKSSYWV